MVRDALIQKAAQSVCRYKLAAFALDKRGEILAKATNSPRFAKLHGGLHAELEALRRGGPATKTILLCRVNASGNLLPIEPCETCAAVLKANKIKVKTVR